MRKNIFHPALILFVGLTIGGAQTAQAQAEAHGKDAPAKVELASDQVTAPFELVGRKPVVEVKINGQGPFKFFLDTGAGATVINQDLADELKLVVKGTTKIGDPHDPEGISAKQNWVDKLEIGGATFSGFVGVSWDRSMLYQPGAPRGVLGMPLFRTLLLTIDYPQSRIGISHGALPKADGAEVLDIQATEGGLFGIAMTVAGKDVVATLDTGSPGELSFPTTYQDTLPLDGKPVVIGHAQTVGGGADIFGAKLNGTVKLGKNVYDNPRVIFFDRLTHLNLGYGFIHDFAITIDQANRRIRFIRFADPPIPVAVMTMSPGATGDLAQYSGTYGERQVTVAEGKVFLQRMSGPHGAGPKLELNQIHKDEFALPASTEVRFKFARDAAGNITELNVLNQDGVWESAVKAAK